MSLASLAHSIRDEVLSTKQRLLTSLNIDVIVVKNIVNILSICDGCERRERWRREERGREGTALSRVEEGLRLSEGL